MRFWVLFQSSVLAGLFYTFSADEGPPPALFLPGLGLGGMQGWSHCHQRENFSTLVLGGGVASGSPPATADVTLAGGHTGPFLLCSRWCPLSPREGNLVTA